MTSLIWDRDFNSSFRDSGPNDMSWKAISADKFFQKYQNFLELNFLNHKKSQSFLTKGQIGFI